MRGNFTALVLALTLPFTLPGGISAQEADGENGAPSPATAPVFFHGRELFLVGPVSEATAEARADEVVQNLKRVARSPRVRTDSIVTKDNEELGVTLIAARDFVIATVWEEEAVLLGKDRLEIAGERIQAIGDAIEKYRHDYSPKAVARGAVYAAVTTALFIAVLLVLGWLRRRGEAALEGRLRKRTLARVVRGEVVVVFVEGAMRLFRLVLVIWLTVLYLNLLLGFFPWTLNFAVQLLDLVLAPLQAFGSAFVDRIPDFFSLGIIVIITRFVLRAVKYVFDEIEKGTIVIKGFYADWSGPTCHIIRALVIAFAVVAAFPYIPGSDSPAFKAISVFLGVLFSLGATSAVANVIAGLILTYMRPFMVGDRVRIGETVGDVTERRLLSTRIHTTKHEQVSVPNTSVVSGHIVNYSELAREEGLILHTTVTIGYDAPWRTVHELLLAAAGDTGDILKEPPPFVRQKSLEDFYVCYELNAATDRPNRMPAIYSEMHQNIQDRFAKGGVEIMSPHYRSERDGSVSTIPKDPDGAGQGAMS